MEMSITKEINQDRQIKKFCLYGFLKNLKFFEPYLLLYLIATGRNLFEIGILIAIREVVINLFEIPSGFISDYFGRKKELCLCFCFYIISFLFFFYSSSFFIATLGMIFFGLGEAFRSGTHKAMIYTYLDHKCWQEHKTYVYGRTRSFSLIGSALSSVLGILFILSVPTDCYIFLFSIIPYIADFILILSYPKYLDTSDKKSSLTPKGMLRELLLTFKTNKVVCRMLLEEGLAEASISYVKDMIQPILEAIIIGSGVMIISSLSADDTLKIILGLVYAMLNLFGSYFSKKSYLLKKHMTGATLIIQFHLGIAVVFFLLALFSKQYIAVIQIYLLLYILQNMRKPIYVDEIDNHIDKATRATILSISAQLKSLFLLILAPLLGLLADKAGFGPVMGILAVLFLVTLPSICCIRK